MDKMITLKFRASEEAAQNLMIAWIEREGITVSTCAGRDDVDLMQVVIENG